MLDQPSHLASDVDALVSAMIDMAIRGISR
jgi:hypothetical protein